jgi:uncharacterized membrane protein YfcA
VTALVLGAALSALAGTVLGLLGGGGAALTVPILLYVVGLQPREAMATSLVVVGVTSAVAAASHARAGRVRFREGLLFGGTGMLGAAAGARVGKDVPPTVLLVMLSGLMVAMALAMLRPRGAAAPRVPGTPRVGRALAAGFGVGTLTGLLGTGGGFLVVPALSLLGGFGMAEAVATSLFVISLNSVAGLGAALVSGTHVAPGLASGMALASVVGSLAGARLGRGLSADTLRLAFAAFLVLLGAAIAVRELSAVTPAVPLALGTAAALAAVGGAAWRMRRGPLPGVPGP